MGYFHENRGRLFGPVSDIDTYHNMRGAGATPPGGVVGGAPAPAPALPAGPGPAPCAPCVPCGPDEPDIPAEEVNVNPDAEEK